MLFWFLIKILYFPSILLLYFHLFVLPQFEKNLRTTRTGKFMFSLLLIRIRDPTFFYCLINGIYLNSANCTFSYRVLSIVPQDEKMAVNVKPEARVKRPRLLSP